MCGFYIWARVPLNPLWIIPHRKQLAGLLFFHIDNLMFPQYWLYIFLHNRIDLATWWRIIWPKSGVFSHFFLYAIDLFVSILEQYHPVWITEFFYVLKISSVRISPARVILFAVLLWIFHVNYEKKWPNNFPKCFAVMFLEIELHL